MIVSFRLPNKIFVEIEIGYGSEEGDASQLLKYIENSNYHELVSKQKIYLPMQLRARALACKAFVDYGLSELSHAVYSFSHKKCASAVCWSNGQGVTNVGIDIEPAENYLHPKAKKFFLNEHDQLADISLVEAWVLKEAAFKCLDRFQLLHTLSAIIIIKTEAGMYVAKSEGYSCKCILLKNNLSYVMAVAWQTEQV